MAPFSTSCNLLRALALGLAFSVSVAKADFDAEVRVASDKVRGAWPASVAKVAAGDVEAGTQALLDLFPEGKRSPAEAFALANTLYRADPKRSYAMHQELAKQLPNEPNVVLEWAMQQHRAGEHAGALAAYDQYSKALPDFAPVHGLAADCLIRLGKVPEGVERWMQSERAQTGTLHNFESLVHAIYGDTTAERRREALRAKAQAGDIDAMIALIGLIARWNFDWWNEGFHPIYLKHDAPLLEQFGDEPRTKAARCVVECGKKGNEASAEDIRAILLNHGFLVDPAKTLPADGTLLSSLLAKAFAAKVLTEEEARTQFGAILRERARNSKDAELWNAIAAVYVGTPEMLEIEEQAWEATGDPRFAAGYLVARQAKNDLTPADPALKKALEQFPEHSEVLAIANSLTGGSDTKLLVQGIKAEYRKFSARGGFLSMRPNARLLRGYFVALQKLPK